MKKKNVIKMIIDFVMLILMLLEYSKVYTGQLVHEVTGIILFILFIIHNLLNIKFYKELLNGKYNFTRIITTIVDLTFLLCMLFTIILGIPISEKVFKFLNIKGNMTIRKLHTIFGYWALVILAIHLGLHFKVIFAKAKNKIHNKKILKYIVWILELVICIYGIIVIKNNNFIEHLTGKYSFGSANGNFIRNLFDNFSIILVISIVTYKLEKLIKNKGEVCYEKRN